MSDVWLADWAECNPPYKGPNWKCGQEASIRVMHLITVAWIMGQDRSPEKGLVDLLVAHLQRIAPTMSYAIGQQNNHGTSEAVALLIGGTFLLDHDERASAWQRNGRRWLEERARTLVEPDGSFSQYSVTYHRVMLDSYSLAEAWRRHRGLPPFSDRLRERLQAATRWLDTMTDVVSGDAPNIGANDGAHLLPLTGADYRDFRPSVELASAQFGVPVANRCPPALSVLAWFVDTDATVKRDDGGVVPSSLSCDQGGYHVLRKGQAFAVLRYPRFRFRPGQADGLHLDLWHAGRNLLRDAGTFSYNAGGAEWFSGTAAHNTVEFDGRDQMPRLGRFLFGDWLQSESVELVVDSGGSVHAAAAYRDRFGACHHRAVLMDESSLVCTDTLSGEFHEATLRWRLEPCEWSLQGNEASGNDVTISISAQDADPTIVIMKSRASRYYQTFSEEPVLMTTVDCPVTLITRITF